MAKAGYDPQKTIAIWEMMEKAQGGSKQAPGFLSTHPVNADRIANLKRIMPEAMRYYREATAGAGSNSIRNNPIRR